MSSSVDVLESPVAIPTCPEPGGYTYTHYLDIPEEPGYRHEILDGVLIREPLPSVQHQRVLRALGLWLTTFLAGFDPEGELFLAPLDITLTERNVLQPDMLFVSSIRRGIIREERIDGPCDLVVEIVSPATRRKDRLQKMQIYETAGIPHYWLVDPEEQTLEAYVLRNGSYTLISRGSQGGIFTHPEFPGLHLELDVIFRRPLPL